MQFNKCSRCGCFFVSSGDVCPNCQPKDMCDMNKLKTFLVECDANSSIEEISYNTGISTKNLHRLFSSDDFANCDFSDIDCGNKFEL